MPCIIPSRSTVPTFGEVTVKANRLASVRASQGTCKSSSPWMLQSREPFFIDFFSQFRKKNKQVLYYIFAYDSLHFRSSILSSWFFWHTIGGLGCLTPTIDENEKIRGRIVTRKYSTTSKFTTAHGIPLFYNGHYNRLDLLRRSKLIQVTCYLWSSPRTFIPEPAKK